MCNLRKAQIVSSECVLLYQNKNTQHKNVINAAYDNALNK